MPTSYEFGAKDIYRSDDGSTDWSFTGVPDEVVTPNIAEGTYLNESYYTVSNANATVAFPAAGHYMAGGSRYELVEVGYQGVYWTASAHSIAGNAYTFNVMWSSFVSPATSQARVKGHSVRCVKYE
jgi:hypothetical protein